MVASMQPAGSGPQMVPGSNIMLPGQQRQMPLQQMAVGMGLQGNSGLQLQLQQQQQLLQLQQRRLSEGQNLGSQPQQMQGMAAASQQQSAVNQQRLQQELQLRQGGLACHPQQAQQQLQQLQQQRQQQQQRLAAQQQGAPVGLPGGGLANASAAQQAQQMNLMRQQQQQQQQQQQTQQQPSQAMGGLQAANRMVMQQQQQQHLQQLQQQQAMQQGSMQRLNPNAPGHSIGGTTLGSNPVAMGLMRGGAAGSQYSAMQSHALFRDTSMPSALGTSASTAAAAVSISGAQGGANHPSLQSRSTSPSVTGGAIGGSVSAPGVKLEGHLGANRGVGGMQISPQTNAALLNSMRQRLPAPSTQSMSALPSSNMGLTTQQSAALLSAAATLEGSFEKREYAYTECFLRGLVSVDRVPEAHDELLAILSGITGTQPSKGLWKDECWRVAVDAEALSHQQGNLLSSSGGFDGEVWLRRYGEPKHLRQHFCARMYSPEHLVVTPSFPTNARRVKEAAVSPNFLKMLNSMGYRRNFTNDVFIRSAIFHHNPGSVEGHLLITVQRHFKDETLTMDMFPSKLVVEVIGRVVDDALIDPISRRILDFCRFLHPYVTFTKL